MDYLVKATPTRELLDLSAADRDELMAAEREVASDLIALAEHPAFPTSLSAVPRTEK